MKIFFSEYRHNYETYTFGYSVYAFRERADETDEIYQRGFLPYTDDFRLPPHVFYKARSVRIDLNAFSNTSENRRVDRKVRPVVQQIEMKKRPLFDSTDEQFRSFCQRFAKERFSPGAFSEDRLDYVLHPALCTHVFTFYDHDGKAIGYVFAQVGQEGFHYWFSFYDLDVGEEVPLGKWMMWKLIHWADRWNMSWVYLGTCYGSGALYKVRDFEGVEFHDGNTWSGEIDELKRRAKSDSEAPERDHFKRLEDPTSFLHDL